MYELRRFSFRLQTFFHLPTSSTSFPITWIHNVVSFLSPSLRVLIDNYSLKQLDIRCSINYTRPVTANIRAP